MVNIWGESAYNSFNCHLDVEVPLVIMTDSNEYVNLKLSVMMDGII